MDMIVCIKQVPDTNEVKIDPKKGTLIRDGVPSIINPEDKHALEGALQIKDQFGGKVTVITMGPPQAKVALREALAMGADEAILVSDWAFAGADTLATSYTLVKTIEKVGKYDLIFCGRQAIDGDTAQVGPEIAEQLDIPQITYVTDLKLENDKVIVERALEDGHAVIETSLPALLTVLTKFNEPRYASMGGIIDAYEKEITVWSVKDLSVEKDKLGLDGSPTQVVKTFTPSQERSGEILKGTDAVNTLLQRLQEKHLV